MSDDEQKLFRDDDHPTDVVTTVADAAATIIGNLGPVGALGEVAINLFTGGSIRKKLQTLAWEVTSEVNRLDYRVDRLAADMQEYVFRLMQEAVPVADQEKLRALRNAMVNVAIGNVEAAWMPSLLECVRDVGRDEVRVLKILYHGYDPPKYAVRENDHEHPRRLLPEALTALGYPPALLTVMIRRLERLGLVRVGRAQVFGDGVFASVDSVDETDLGERFFELINTPESASRSHDDR
jgi:hypothetical protein